MINRLTALLILRLGFGVNMAMHGLVRFPKLETFVLKASAGFSETVLPDFLVKAFLYSLPFAEFIAGTMVLIGGKLGRPGFALGGLIITTLIFGTTLKEDWAGAGNQLVYIIVAAMGLFLYQQKEKS